MKERIDITGKTRQEVMVLCNCSKTIAKNALKRGYYVVDYKKRTCTPMRSVATGWPGFLLSAFFAIAACGTLGLGSQAALILDFSWG